MDANKEQCPVAITASLLSDESTILIIRDLLNGPKRFCKIGKDGNNKLLMSTRTLSKKLKELELNAIISRKKFNESPPRVEYTLTKKGRDLEETIQAMRAYGKKYTP
jgi:DNA-binding HxlR family transcriptional regulator